MRRGLTRPKHQRLQNWRCPWNVRALSQRDTSLVSSAETGTHSCGVGDFSLKNTQRKRLGIPLKFAIAFHILNLVNSIIITKDLFFLVVLHTSLVNY